MPQMTPEQYKQMALDKMKNAKGPWDRGEEAGLDELSGVDILREPKQAAMDSVGPGALQQLIDMLVPTEIGLPSAQGAGMGMAAMGVIKPKTKAKDLVTKGLDIWDKDKVAKDIAEKLGGDKAIPMWKKKMMQPKD